MKYSNRHQHVCSSEYIVYTAFKNTIESIIIDGHSSYIDCSLGHLFPWQYWTSYLCLTQLNTCHLITDNIVSSNITMVTSSYEMWKIRPVENSTMIQKINCTWSIIFSNKMYWNKISFKLLHITIISKTASLNSLFRVYSKH